MKKLLVGAMIILCASLRADVRAPSLKVPSIVTNNATAIIEVDCAGGTVPADRSLSSQITIGPRHSFPMEANLNRICQQKFGEGAYAFKVAFFIGDNPEPDILSERNQAAMYVTTT